MKRAVAGRGSPRPGVRPADDIPDDIREDRAILSFTLLLATLAAGFVTSLGLAETNPVLTTLVSILN